MHCMFGYVDEIPRFATEVCGVDYVCRRCFLWSEGKSIHRNRLIILNTEQEMFSKLQKERVLLAITGKDLQN